ncbi:hypothetical protein IT881_15060 [Erythrobacter sp. A30-3]|nr:hypothetical protein IT881_15060 [Erythrobacter sp. A30-3]
MAKTATIPATTDSSSQRAARRRPLRIDLNTVPSSMEQLAASWKGNRG